MTQEPKMRKQDIDRLARVLDEWREQEANLYSHYGPCGDAPGTLRSMRLKDAQSLQRAISFILAARNAQKVQA